MVEGNFVVYVLLEVVCYNIFDGFLGLIEMYNVVVCEVCLFCRCICLEGINVNIIGRMLK